MWQGPQAQTHADRWRMVDRITADLHRVYGDDVVAMALYGSLACGEDGDYSDIELWCAVDRPGLDTTAEWVYGPGKAEVNVYGVDVLRRDAAAVSDGWALWQGQFVYARPLYGDLAFFEEVQRFVYASPKPTFDAMIRAMLVGECYEWVGKARNAQRHGSTATLAGMTVDFSTTVAFMLGLAHRHVYRSRRTMLDEARGLSVVPDGLDELCRLVTTGDLADPARVVAALEAVWAGLERWCVDMQIDVPPIMDWPWP
jgi:kanamycin nucleotidyltransferase